MLVFTLVVGFECLGLLLVVGGCLFSCLLVFGDIVSCVYCFYWFAVYLVIVVLLAVGLISCVWFCCLFVYGQAVGVLRWVCLFRIGLFAIVIWCVSVLCVVIVFWFWFDSSRFLVSVVAGLIDLLLLRNCVLERVCFCLFECLVVLLFVALCGGLGKWDLIGI